MVGDLHLGEFAFGVPVAVAAVAWAVFEMGFDGLLVTAAGAISNKKFEMMKGALPKQGRDGLASVRDGDGS